MSEQLLVGKQRAVAECWFLRSESNDAPLFPEGGKEEPIRLLAFSLQIVLKRETTSELEPLTCSLRVS